MHLRKGDLKWCAANAEQKTQSNLNFVENVEQPLAFGFHALNVGFRILETLFSALNVEKG